MDLSDTATQAEEMQRSEALHNARRPSNPAITEKRRRVAEAREIAGQRGANDPDIVLMGVKCENCEDPLTLASEDIFCCVECADDWERRTRAQHIAGH